MLAIFAVSLALRLVNLGGYPRWFVDEGSVAEQGINMFHLHYGYKTWGPNFFPPFFVMLDGQASQSPLMWPRMSPCNQATY